jgi:hypothetical protein
MSNKLIFLICGALPLVPMKYSLFDYLDKCESAVTNMVTYIIYYSSHAFVRSR